MDPVALQTELTRLVEQLNTSRKPGETIKLDKNVNTYNRIIEICDKLKAMDIECKGGKRKTRRNRRQRRTRRH
jgi:biopolymer transport protein ExbD